MKKFYISPKTETIEVKIESLLVTMSAEGVAQEGDHALSREGDAFWDDEE